MDYDLKKFKRDKTSIVPIEEVYTDLDIKEDDPCDPSVGYRFDAPHRWVQDKSISKSVGIRDLKLTPSSGDIRCRFVHFLNPCVYAFSATWDSTNSRYDIDYDNAELKSLGGSNFYITNDIFENITPGNGFEEIITDLLFSKLTGSEWREIRKAKKATDYWYESYAAKTAKTRWLYFNSSNGNSIDVNNKSPLPIPTTFEYRYNSNTSQFSIKTIEDLRSINMENASKVSGIDKNGQITLSDQGYGDYETVDDATAQIQNLTKAYVPNPTFGNSELLLITSDNSSLKNIYALFNQRFPQKQRVDGNGRLIGFEDDITKIATIKIDNKVYYVPFIHKDGDSLVTIKNVPYNSYFCLNNKAAGRTANLTGEQTDINNLSLDNVWDRIHLIYHASFAETRMRIIGRNNDHWDSPNKRFIVPSGDQDEFYLKFSTDGKHNILPIGCHFNVDLCFMLNTTNNTATGNNDAFKQ